MTQNVGMIGHVQNINVQTHVTSRSHVGIRHYARRYLIDPSVGVQMDGEAILTKNALNVGFILDRFQHFTLFLINLHLQKYKTTLMTLQMNAKEILTAHKIKHVLRTSVVTLAKRFCVAIEQHVRQSPIGLFVLAPSGCRAIRQWVALKQAVGLIMIVKTTKNVNSLQKNVFLFAQIILVLKVHHAVRVITKSSACVTIHWKEMDTHRVMSQVSLRFNQSINQKRYIHETIEQE